VRGKEQHPTSIASCFRQISQAGFDDRVPSHELSAVAEKAEESNDDRR